MPRVAREKCHTGFYHVVIRGNGKQIIFEDESDFNFFKKRMRKYKTLEKVEIHAFCLMDNHVHLLLRATSGGVDSFMKRLQCSYARYYNTKYERRGHLFQDRFYSDAITDRRRYFACIRYILKNPEEAGICSFEKYRHSSFTDFWDPDGMCNADYALKLAGGMQAMMNFLEAAPESGDEVSFDAPNTSKREFKAKKLIRDILGVDNGLDIQAFEKNKRDESIARLKKEGLSVRQIERLTGVGRGVIQRIQLE